MPRTIDQGRSTEVPRSDGVLAVVGDPQAVGAAAWAARCSGRRVAVATARTGPPITRIDSDVADDPATADPGRGSVVHDLAPHADVWLVVSRAGEFDEVLRRHADRMAGADILLAPGAFGGAVRAQAWFARHRLPAPRIAETTGFPVLGSQQDDRYRIRAVKRRLPLAAVDPVTTTDLLERFRPWLPDLVAGDLATTSLGNTNHLIHPPLVITNGVRIAGQQAFTLYRDGLADGVDPLLAAVDEERRDLVRSLGGDDRSGVDWLLRFYADQGMVGDTVVQALRSFPAFAATPAPPGFDYRYLTDDVPYGIAAWAALAERLGTPHRRLSALQTLAETLLGRPLGPPPELIDVVADQLAAPAVDRPDSASPVR